MKIITLPYWYQGMQFELAWYGYRNLQPQQPHLISIFGFKGEYLAESIVDWDVISIADRISTDFPCYEEIAEAASDTGPVVKLADARVKVPKIKTDQVPLILESTFFPSDSDQPRQYLNFGPPDSGYFVIFRLARPLKGPFFQDSKPPPFDPKIDRVFVVGTEFVAD